MKNKIALITGASRGIGKAIALHLASEEIFVIMHYASNDKAARQTLDEVNAIDGNGVLIKSDFSSVKGIEYLFEEVDKVLKRDKIDILINNAGILNKFDLENITEAQFDSQFSINVKSPFFITQQALTRLNDGGRIINISSYLSKRPKYEYGAYAMTKSSD